jgi:hypothetical protein
LWLDWCRGKKLEEKVLIIIIIKEKILGERGRYAKG